MTAPLPNLTDTWNNGGTVFKGLQLVVTDTAHAAGSRYIDLIQGPSTTVFAVESDGTVTMPWGVNIGSNNCVITSTGSISIISTGLFSWSGNTALASDAAGIFAQRNSTNAQTFRVYNTFTDASNYERGGFDWTTTANTFRIRSENAGTGTNRIIAIDAFAKAGAAVAADIPAGTFAMVRDTSGATTKLIYNNAGTLMTVALT
jgi:hypothetical protein